MAENEQVNPETPEEEEEEFVLTPEIMEYENRRNDIILSIGLLAFTFSLGAFQEDISDIYLRLKTGELISETLPGVPKEDSFSYTTEGKSLVNPSWLFDLSIFQIYSNFGEVTLIVVKALILAATAGLMLLVRHRGPTLWGTVLATALAMTVMSVRASVSPESLGYLLLAALIVIWFAMKYRGKQGLIYLAIPITIVWAQIDVVWILAPVLMLLWSLGEFLNRFLPTGMCDSDNLLDSKQVVKLAGITVVCFAAGIVSPYTIGNLTLPFEWFATVLPDVPVYSRAGLDWQPMSLGRFIDSVLGMESSRWGDYAWPILVLLSIGSCFLNFNKLSVGRTLMLLLALMMPMLAYRLIVPSAMMIAVVVSLNGQEFFLQNWGTETRIGRGWMIWSQVGRALTIFALLLVGIPAAFTGRVQNYVDRFGFGINESRFPVEAEQWLRDNEIPGNGFPFLNRLASYRVWASPGHKCFVDSRWHLYGDALAKFSDARRSLVADEENKDAWKKIFDEYNITHVILDPRELSLDRYARLLIDPDFATLYVSDQAIVFGRTDDTVAKAKVDELRIDSNQVVFKADRDPPTPTDRYVIAPGIIDWVWNSRYSVPAGLVSGSVFSSAAMFPPGQEPFKRPGADYEAIRHFRNAVAENPDNPQAYLQLAMAHRNVYRLELDAYMTFVQQKYTEYQKQQQAANAPANENANEANANPEQVVGNTDNNANADPGGAGIAAALNPNASAAAPQQNFPQLRVPRPRDLMPLRHFQMMAAIQNSIAAGARGWAAHMIMYEICTENELFDLALHHLDIAISRMPPDRAEVVTQQLKIRLELDVEENLDRYERAIEQMEQGLLSANMNTDVPIERARWALSFGLAKLAREQYESASPFAPETQQAAGFAGTLYLLLGLPEIAQSRFQDAQRQQQLQAGDLESWLAQIRILNGQYDLARDRLEHSIAEARRATATDSIEGMSQLVRGGQVGPMFGDAGTINKTFNNREREAKYLFHLALLRIEMGQPEFAINAFREMLELSPRSTMRPIVKMYWQLITDEEFPADPPDITIDDLVAIKFEADEEKVEKPVGPENKLPANANADNASKTTAPQPAKAEKKAATTDKKAAKPNISKEQPATKKSKAQSAKSKAE